MESIVDLNLVLLRTEKNSKVAHYLLQLLETHQATTVCNALLEAVETERLRPAPVSIFLATNKSIHCVKACLYQQFSVDIRRFAIRQFAKALADNTRWKDAWLAIGSVQGVLDYLKRCSVREVKEFCAKVGRCDTKGAKLADRAAAIEDLAKSMNPAKYPDASRKTSDKRPLERFVALLLPSCSSEFVKECLAQGLQNVLYNGCNKKALLKSHTDVLLQRTVQIVVHEQPLDISSDIELYLRQLTSNTPSTRSAQKYLSASMKFSQQLLEKCIQDTGIDLPDGLPASDIYFRLLKRCLKRHIPKAKLHEVMDLGMELLKARPKLEARFKAQKSFWDSIKTFWVKWPEHWQDLIIKGLKLGLSGSKNNISQSFLTFVGTEDFKNIGGEDYWNMFKLFCQTLTEGKVDIEKAQTFNLLTKQRWNYDLLRRLPIDRRIDFLQNLLNAKPQCNFLHGTPPDSVLAMTRGTEQENLNALLLLTQLQISSSDKQSKSQAYDRSVEAYSSLKAKSSSAREQEQRASYATIAGSWAITSGSIDLFANHVSWLSRYIRDPLTLKAVFARNAIGSREASDLLSGIPHPIPPSVTLSDISSTVAAANQVFFTLHEHYKIANREPSFQDSDWSAVRSLLQDSIRTRISRAEKLQDALEASQGDLYAELWSQTLEMSTKVDSSSQSMILILLQDLFLTLPPKLLASITQHLLELDNKQRAAKAEGKSANETSLTLERMVYSCLLRLVRSDDPTLATQLVVKTVIDRPDASSWHRQFLGLNFFQRLPSDDAERLLLSFSKAIGEKLEEQSYIRIGEAVGAPSIVKVTTVKYLAQLLQNAQFLSPKASIQVLVELFKVAVHPDIRLATLESMLTTLESLAASEKSIPVSELSEVTNPLIRQILEALNEIIPVVGGINERRPANVQDWIEANEDLSKLPAPSQWYERPLWGALVEATRRIEDYKPYFIKHLILPAIKEAVSEHQKWLGLFLKKHNAGFAVEVFPKEVPANTRMLSELCYNFSRYTPRAILDSWDLYTRFLLCKPAFVNQFTARLQADSGKRNKADVEYFLAVFNDQTGHVIANGTGLLIDILQTKWEPSALSTKEGVSLTQIQTAIIEQSRILLQSYDDKASNWDYVVSKLRHSSSSPDEYDKWIKTCRPILEEIVKMIVNARTPQWEQDVNRKPTILPTAIKPSLWMMDYPVPGQSQEATDSKAIALGNSIVVLLKHQLSDVRRLVSTDRLLMDVLSIDAKLNARQKIQVALALCKYGTSEGSSHIEEYFYVRLSIKLIASSKGAMDKDVPLRKQVYHMIKKWQSSSVEEVREFVLDLINSESHGKLWDLISQRA